MKLLVFSDIHGNIYALEKLLERLETFSYDKIIFLGDIFGYYYHQKETIARLKEIPDLIWLKGNHDSYAVDIYFGRCKEEKYVARFGSSYQNLSLNFLEKDIKHIETMPTSVILNSDGEKIGIFHGTPYNPVEGRQYPNASIDFPEVYEDYNIVILGHTHWRMLRYVGDTMIINPGSLGQPRDGKGFCFAIVDTLLRKVEFIEVEINRFLLYEEIERKDPSMKNLKDILERSI